MTEQPLKEAIRELIREGGHLMKSRLSERSGCSVHLIEKILSRKGHTPKEENIVALRRALKELKFSLESHPRPAA